MKHGSYYQQGKGVFQVWAPLVDRLDLHLISSGRRLEMKKNEEGYFRVEADDVVKGERYLFTMAGEELPDPASRFQPEGVHGPSQLTEPSSFVWTDAEWKGRDFKELVLYELHVGTFTEEGTFDAIIPLLDDLLDTGINALELMPVNQFPGNRDWGYDGVYPYAVQHSYGGPEGLKRLVDACHRKGMAVYLDVVYNHMGPEGNYLPRFGPYFTDRYCTPWGQAVNLDWQWSDGVREYLAENVRYWLEEFHLDGLRCDAIHEMYDRTAVHFWEMVNEQVKAYRQECGRLMYLIAESDLNNPKVVTPVGAGGFGFDAQWLDDFHHAWYALLNTKDKKRYADFGRMDQLAKAYNEGFVHSGQYSMFRKRKYGRSSAAVEGEHFVAFQLNHDQAGNRLRGERLSMLVDASRLKLAAAGLLLAPYVPMLFMGEEYGEDVPFFYFVSYADEKLRQAVIEGRKEEFKDYKMEGEPQDPNLEQTFIQSRLQWKKRKEGKYAQLLSWYKDLLHLRAGKKALKNFRREGTRAVSIGEEGLVLFRSSEDGAEHLLCFFNLSEQPLDVKDLVEKRTWVKAMDSLDAVYGGSGLDLHADEFSGEETFTIQPLCAVVYSNH